MTQPYKTVHTRLFMAQHEYEQGNYKEAQKQLKHLYAQWKNDELHFCVLDELKLFILLDQTNRQIVSHET